MSTPIGTLTPYCTPAQAVIYVNWKQWADLIPDNDTRLANSAAVVSDTTKLPTWLMEASGEVEGACLMAGRYSVADLQGLIGASAAKLAGIVARIAFFNAYTAKYPLADPEGLLICKPAYEALAMLSEGRAIFGIQEVADAGVSETVETWSPPPNSNAVSQQAYRFFGQRCPD